MGVWTKVGLLLTALWIVGAAYYQRQSDTSTAQQFADRSYWICEQEKKLKNDPDLRPCDREREKGLALFMDPSWGNVAAIALVPVPVGWLLGFAFLTIGRAQVAGFRVAIPWSASSRSRKALFVASGLAAMGFGLFALLDVLNVYTDRRVPTSLGPFMIVRTGDDLALLKGTWTRSDSSDSAALETSRIVCNRQTSRCIEGKASVSDAVLSADMNEYVIERWTDTTIVFKDEGLCVREVYTVDLKAEAVTGYGERLGLNEPACRWPNDDGRERKWTYRLENGFPIYWRKRMDARSRLLRVLQSMLGN